MEIKETVVVAIVSKACKPTLCRRAKWVNFSNYIHSIKANFKVKLLKHLTKIIFLWSLEINRIELPCWPWFASRFGTLELSAVSFRYFQANSTSHFKAKYSLKAFSTFFWFHNASVSSAYKLLPRTRSCLSSLKLARELFRLSIKRRE